MDKRIHRERCLHRRDSGCMFYRLGGFGGSKIFMDVFIWPFAILFELAKDLQTKSTVRLVQVLKKFLLMAFVQEEIFGLKAD